jgi:hypothetical protein
MCMLRLILCLVWQHIFIFLSSNTDTTSFNLSNFNTILVELHICRFDWRHNNLPNLYNCSITDSLLEIRIKFDS